MALLDRKELLKKEDLKIEKVDLGNGEFVYVRQMSAREKDQFEMSLMKPIYDDSGNLIRMEQTLEDFRAKLAVNTICDEKGNLILLPDDYVLLSKNISAAKLEKIVNVAQRLNRITEKDKEELVKNSEQGPVDDSLSDSARH